MSLLRLAPEILEYIDGLDGTEGCLHLTARRLRDIAVLNDHDKQRFRFRDLVGGALATSPPTSRSVTSEAVASRENVHSAQAGAYARSQTKT